MKSRRTEVRAALGPFAWLALTIASPLTGAGCQPSTPGPAATTTKPPTPSKVENAIKEADLAKVTLTPEAETRLGVATAPVERKAVPRTVLYAGEAVVPPGRLIAVTAPFVGTVKAVSGSEGLPSPGTQVKAGQPVCVLVPLLSPEARATLAPLLMEAEGQVKQTTDQLNIAKVALDRAEKRARDGLGGSAARVDARAQYDLATTNLKNAQARRSTIETVANEAGTGERSVRTITAPSSGTVQNLHATPGQAVAPGAALFEVVSLDPLWVKVAVYVGEAARVAPDRPATVGGLSDFDNAGGPSPREAKPVAAPPSGDALAATVHLYYEVANKDGAIRPGERVGVTLPLTGAAEALTAPRASVIRDIHGGAWVYEKVGDHAYSRRRVLVDRVVGNVAVLASGPKPGALVVTDGAAEIYGAEFGGGK